MEGELAAGYCKDHPEVDKNEDGLIQYVVMEGEAGHQDAIVWTEYSVSTLEEEGIETEKYRKTACFIRNKRFPWRAAENSNP